jgi:hypothetical protein
MKNTRVMEKLVINAHVHSIHGKLKGHEGGIGASHVNCEVVNVAISSPTENLDFKARFPFKGGFVVRSSLEVRTILLCWVKLQCSKYKFGLFYEM